MSGVTVSILDCSCDTQCDVEIINSDTDEVLEILIPGPAGPSGGSIVPTKTITTDTSLINSDYFIRSNSDEDLVVSLPDATTNVGKVYVVKNVNVGHTMIVALGDDVIDGNPTVTLTHQYESLNFAAYAGGWDIW